MERLADDEIRRAVKAALAEDIGPGDATTLATVPPDSTARAMLRSREPIIVAGLRFAELAFKELSPDIVVNSLARDGQQVGENYVLLEVAGSTHAILGAERIALNFVQRLSGIATMTAQCVEAVKDLPAHIRDTRKTTPGMRRFEKYAVACGGGQNHRFGLHDMILIKDNHLAALRNEPPNAIAAAIQRAKAKYPHLKVEVEADTLEQVEQAVAAGAELILLDNMSLADMRLAVQKCQGRAFTEASGGITFDKLHAIAETGVDFISIGALTHSVRAVDVGLDFET